MNDIHKSLKLAILEYAEWVHEFFEMAKLLPHLSIKKEEHQEYS